MPVRKKCGNLSYEPRILFSLLFFKCVVIYTAIWYLFCMLLFHLLGLVHLIIFSLMIHSFYYNHFTHLRVLSKSGNWWFSKGILATASLFKSLGLFLLYWPISTMLLFVWYPLVPLIPSPPVPLVTVPTAPITIAITVTSMFHSFFNSLVIIIMSCSQHVYPWPSLATSPYRPSLLAGPQGYIPYPHITAVCRFELVALLLRDHMRGSIGVIHWWAHPCMSGSSKFDSFRDGRWVAVQLVLCGCRQAFSPAV